MKVSVIVPVYNAEKFAGRCLDSLLVQTHSDWEAVCVDDGSTDGSLSVLESYASSDDRIKVLSKVNGGVSSARNEAMSHIGGDCVLFVDSDDFIHPQTMEICCSQMERDGSDIVAFTYDRAFHTRMTIRLLFGLGMPSRMKYREYGDVESIVTESPFDYCTEYSSPKNVADPAWAVKHCQLWRCMYRRHIVEDIRFHEGIIYEDFPWWSEVLLKCRRMTINNLPLYYYFPNPVSYIHSSSGGFKVESLRIAIGEAVKLYEDAPVEIKEKWEREFLSPFAAKLAKKEKKMK